ncbi:MAG: hypothetical protein MI723_01065 [Caulobacterales bacterium]|nr:hypothetical protein [Caulobacterales bacterium]
MKTAPKPSDSAKAQTQEAEVEPKLVQASDAYATRSTTPAGAMLAMTEALASLPEDDDRWPRLYVTLFVLVTCGSFWIVVALLLRRLFMSS